MTVERHQNGAAITDRTHSSVASDREIVLQKSGLIFKRSVPFRRWELIGHQLFASAESSTWWIADWLAYGEAAFQARYREAIEVTSLSYQTLRNYAWVARRFKPSRRRDTLSFGHHAEVASLGIPESDYWLRKSEEYRWSRNRLRSEVRASLRERQGQYFPSFGAVPGEGEGPGSPVSLLPGASDVQMLSLPLTADQVLRFSAAASDQNMVLTEWAVKVLDRAATGLYLTPGLAVPAGSAPLTGGASGRSGH